MGNIQVFKYSWPGSVYLSLSPTRVREIRISWDLRDLFRLTAYPDYTYLSRINSKLMKKYAKLIIYCINTNHISYLITIHGIECVSNYLHLEKEISSGVKRYENAKSKIKINLDGE